MFRRVRENQKNKESKAEVREKVSAAFWGIPFFKAKYVTTPLTDDI